MKLRINEGAQNKPFILTSDELSKLLQSSQEITLEGYYNMADGTLQNADYQRFKSKFPDANMLASVIPDGEWSVSLLNADLSEGNSTKLQVVGANLIDLSASIYSVSNSNSSITENQIKSLIKIEGDTIRTSLLNINKDNVATVVIRVQKSYDSSDFKDVVLSIRQVAMTFTIEGINKEVVEGSSEDLYNLYPLGNYGPDTAHVFTIRTNKNNTKEPLAQFNTTCVYGQVSAVNNKRFTYYVKNTDADDTIVVGLKLQTDVIQTQIQATVYCTNVYIEGLKGSNLLIDFSTTISNYQYVSTGIEKYDEQIKETHELFFLESNGKTVKFMFGRTSSVITRDLTLATKQLRDFVLYDEDQKVTGFGLPNLTVTYNGISDDNNITNRFIVFKADFNEGNVATFGDITIHKIGGTSTVITKSNNNVYSGGDIVFFEIESTNSGFKISDYVTKNLLYETSEVIQGTFSYNNCFSWKQTLNTETVVTVGSILYHAIKASFKINNKYSSITLEKEDIHINFNPRLRVYGKLIRYRKEFPIVNPKLECSSELLTLIVKDNTLYFYQLGFIEEKELHVKVFFGDGKPFPLYDGVVKTLQPSYAQRRISQGKVQFSSVYRADRYLVKPSSKFEFFIEGSLVSDANFNVFNVDIYIIFDYKKFNPFDKGKFREIIQYEKGDKVYETEEFNLELGFSRPMSSHVLTFPFRNHHLSEDLSHYTNKIDTNTICSVKPIVVCGASTPYPDKRFILTASNYSTLMGWVDEGKAELWARVSCRLAWDYAGSVAYRIDGNTGNEVFNVNSFGLLLKASTAYNTNGRIESLGNIPYDRKFSMRMNAFFWILMRAFYNSFLSHAQLQTWDISRIVEGKIPLFSLVDGEIAILGKTKVFTEMWTGDYKIYDQDGSILSNVRKYFSATSYEDGSVRVALSDESTQWSYEVSPSSNYQFPYVSGKNTPNKAARQELPFFVTDITGEDFTG